MATPPFPEENRFCGIPFKLTAPEKNGGKAMIALRGNNRALKLPGKIQDIPVGQKADQLWFINAANYVPAEKGVVIAKYVIRYDDDSQVDFPLRSGVEINDWCPGKKPEKARVCWTGNNRAHSAGLYLTEWKNPFPGKVIKAIDIIGALQGAQLGVIGITGGRIIADGAGSAPLAKWDFGDFQDGKIPDSLGHTALSLQKEPAVSADPVKTELNSQTALKLDGCQYFMGTLTNIADFNPAQPFSVKVVFSLDALPKDDRGSFGIYQAMLYGTSGFSLAVDQHAKLAVWGFNTPHDKAVQLKGKTQLALGQPYTVCLSFSGQQMKMTLNGKLEALATGTAPAPYKGGILVGHTSGGGLLKGSLQSVELSRDNP